MLESHPSSNASASPIASKRPRFLATPLGWSLLIYLIFRVGLTLWMALSVGLSGAPSEPWGEWLDRVLLRPNERYDVEWYLGIARDGYLYRQGATAYHPLYPLLIGLLGRALGGAYLLAAWLIVQVACVAMLYLLHRLVALDYGDALARRATLLLMASPLGFSFLIPYTEALLVLCFVGAFYAARSGRWWLAGLAGAGAALTKQTGVVVFLPLLWELWQAQQAELKARHWLPTLARLLPLLLIPLALAGFLIYRGSLGDTHFDWRDPFSIFSLLVTPDYQEVWGTSFGWPWENLVNALSELARNPYFYLIINVLGALAGIGLTCAVILRLRPSYKIFVTILALLSLSLVNFGTHIYMSIGRHFSSAFPIFIQLARWTSSRRTLFLLTLLVGQILWLLLSWLYIKGRFIP